MRELLEKIDIYGKLEKLGLMAKTNETALQISKELQDKYKLKEGTSLLLGYTVSFIQAAWKEYRTVILIVAGIILIVGIVRIAENKYEKWSYKKKKQEWENIEKE